MAVVNIQVVNPTNAAVTVIPLDNTTADAYGFLAAGCALVSDAAGTVVSREQAGWLMRTGATVVP